MNRRRRGLGFAVALAAAAIAMGPNAALASAVSVDSPGLTPAIRVAGTPIADRAAASDERLGAARMAAAPVTLTIKTAPPLPGVRVSLDGTTVVTDQAGIVSFTQDHNLDQHTLTLVDTDIKAGDRRYTFARWVGQRDPDQAFTATLDALPMRVSDTVTAAFAVRQTVIPRFVDQDGRPIDPALVSSATARSDNGAAVTIAPTGKTWLQRTRIDYRSHGLEVQDVSYSWQTVMVAGSNVVDSGRQSFTPAKTPEPTVAGQFHDLTVTGYDALLGSGAGAEAVITFPDGTVRTAPMDSGHSAVFTHLPRGSYQAEVSAGRSIVAGQLIRLSRDITSNVPVISLVDIGIVVGAVALLAVGLVLIGRKNIRRRVLAPFRGAALAKVDAP